MQQNANPSAPPSYDFSTERQTAEAFAAALHRRDWAEARQHLLDARQRGAAVLPWALRECDWFMAQQRWGEAAERLRGLLDVSDAPRVFQLVVRHNLATIDLARHEPMSATAWLSPLLEPDGMAVAPPEGFEVVQIGWIRSLHRSGQGARLRRWVMRIEALGLLSPAVAAVASVASWEWGDLVPARHWSRQADVAAASAAAPMEATLIHALLALDDHDAPRARALAEAAAQRWPDEGCPWIALGCAHLLAGDAAAALPAFERASGAAPKDAAAWRGKGWAQLLTGLPVEARKSFADALALDEDHGETHGALATLLALQARREEAQLHLAHCERINPQSPAGRHARQLLTPEAERSVDLAAVFVALARRQTLPPVPHSVALPTSAVGPDAAPAQPAPLQRTASAASL